MSASLSGWIRAGNAGGSLKSNRHRQAYAFGLEVAMIHVGYIALALTFAASSALAAPALEGNWARGDGKAQVRIGPCGSDECAVNTWMRADVRGEKVGDKLVMTVRQTGDAMWKGKAFDPQRNLTYGITIRAEDAAMVTTGCLLGLICKSMGWTRISGPAETGAAR